MKYYHQCVTGHGTELWARTATFFGAAMAVFGPQGATHIKGNGKDGDKVEYTGGWVYRQSITERAEQNAKELQEEFIKDLVVHAIEVEGYAIDTKGNLIHESDLDPETHLEQAYARVRYGVYLVFEGAGRDGVADFVDRDDAEAARDELITYFGLDAPAPPGEDT